MNTNRAPMDIHAGRRKKRLSLIRAKACTRCGGDLSIECDVYGVYIECIQCGATWNRNDIKLTTCPVTGAMRVEKVAPPPVNAVVK